ncbi:MAG: acetyl-CoA acetyltransferase [Acidobacteria bacterium 37-65-4]|nr:MAG: acetyl-CoA acetyltransferase [Acidobacteria bacterium 37-65-4]
MSDPIVILSGARTGIAKFQGPFAGFAAPEIGAFALREALSRGSVDPAEIEEVILGNVLQAGVGQNPARQAALKAGLPVSVAAFTVNKVCGSGLKSVMLAAQAIKAGDAGILLAGGMESMSNAPYLLRKARAGYRLGHGEVTDSLVADGLTDAYDGQHMGLTAELVASEHGISREAMDAYSVKSHQKASTAWAAGKFEGETFAVPLPQKKGDPVMFRADEGIRADVTLEGLAKLGPAFKKDGVVTAGNSSQINDSAAAVVVTTASVAEKKGIQPLGRVVAYATAGLEPKWVMMTPEPAVRAAAAKAGWDLKDVDLFELNEAFAAQSCALLKVLGLPEDKVNVNGGAVALGHPIGASGARCLLTLLYAMKDRGAKRGIVSLCLGGGNGVAMAVEAV